MITLLIIGITVLVSIGAMDNQSLKSKMMFNAYLINHRKQWYRFFSNGLIHADWMHLGFNMYALYIFGRATESGYAAVFEAKGFFLYILLYVGGLFISSIYSFEKHKNDIYYNSLGASGAVSSVIFAFIILAPTAKLGILFLPIPGGVSAWIFGLAYLGIEYYLSKRGNSNIGHDAHFWGAVFGILFTIMLKPSLFNIFIDKITG